MPTQVISLRIEHELLKALNERADKEHRTLSNMIIAILLDSSKTWEDSDMWKFTRDHNGTKVKDWGAYIGKDDGYEPFGWMIDYENKVYYFGLDGHLVKTKVK